MKSSYIMVKVPYTIQTEPILKEHSTTERKKYGKNISPDQTYEGEWVDNFPEGQG